MRKPKQKYAPRSFLPAKDLEREAVRVRRWVPTWYRHPPTLDSGGGEIRSHPYFPLWHAQVHVNGELIQRNWREQGLKTLTLHQFFSTTHNLYLLSYFKDPNFLQCCVTTSLGPVIRLDCGKGQTQMGTPHNRIATYDHSLWECVLLPFLGQKLEITSAVVN